MQSVTTYLLTAACLLLAACAQDPALGRLERDRQVEATFVSATILPGHRYVAFGPEAEPDAVAAIDASFVNLSNYWYDISPDPKYFKDLRRQQESNPLRERTPPYGAVILTPDGRRAGVWYGWPDFVVVRFPQEGQIQLYPPEPSQLQRLSIGAQDEPGPRLRP